MYAVFQSGSKQYLVRKNQIVRLEKLNVAIGETIEFKKVIMIANGDNIQINTPFINNSKITAEVIAQNRGDKVTIMKFCRRKHFRKRHNHRQWFTDVKIIDISA